jgi:hypothetical protein
VISAGLCTSSVIFPVDVVRRRLQVQGALTSVTPYSRYHGPSWEFLDFEIDYSGKNNNNNYSYGDSHENKEIKEAPAEKVKKPRPTALKEFRLIYRNEGMKGFYRGIVPELLKVCPMIAVTFCTYEFVLEKLSAVAR